MVVLYVRREFRKVGEVDSVYGGFVLLGRATLAFQVVLVTAMGDSHTNLLDYLSRD